MALHLNRKNLFNHLGKGEVAAAATQFAVIGVARCRAQEAVEDAVVKMEKKLKTGITRAVKTLKSCDELREHESYKQLLQQCDVALAYLGCFLLTHQANLKDCTEGPMTKGDADLIVEEAVSGFDLATLSAKHNQYQQGAIMSVDMLPVENASQMKTAAEVKGNIKRAKAESKNAQTSLNVTNCSLGSWRSAPPPDAKKALAAKGEMAKRQAQEMRKDDQRHTREEEASRLQGAARAALNSVTAALSDTRACFSINFGARGDPAIKQVKAGAGVADQWEENGNSPLQTFMISDVDNFRLDD